MGWRSVGRTATLVAGCAASYIPGRIGEELFDIAIRVHLLLMDPITAEPDMATDLGVPSPAVHADAEHTPSVPAATMTAEDTVLRPSDKLPLLRSDDQVHADEVVPTTVGGVLCKATAEEATNVAAAAEIMTQLPVVRHVALAGVTQDETVTMLAPETVVLLSGKATRAALVITTTEEDLQEMVTGDEPVLLGLQRHKARRDMKITGVHDRGKIPPKGGGSRFHGFIWAAIDAVECRAMALLDRAGVAAGHVKGWASRLLSQAQEAGCHAKAQARRHGWDIKLLRILKGVVWLVMDHKIKTVKSSSLLFQFYHILRREFI